MNSLETSECMSYLYGKIVRQNLNQLTLISNKRKLRLVHLLKERAGTVYVVWSNILLLGYKPLLAAQTLTVVTAAMVNPDYAEILL